MLNINVSQQEQDPDAGVAYLLNKKPTLQYIQLERSNLNSWKSFS